MTFKRSTFTCGVYLRDDQQPGTHVMWKQAMLMKLINPLYNIQGVAQGGRGIKYSQLIIIYF